MIDVKALFSLSYGLYIVSTGYDGKLNGQIINAMIQVTSEPICIAVCLNKDNYTTELLEKSGYFSASVLDNDVSMPFIGNFGFRSGRSHDKFANCKEWVIGENGAPKVKENCIAAIEAKVISVTSAYTHKIFVGEVTSAEYIREGKPLSYADYHILKKGKAPANAPSAIFNKL
ncbi:MAG: flavin reductase family protein [Synergistaceae bacterium]|nr:flavin reductase family protein [Synergistaceae bacterium]